MRYFIPFLLLSLTACTSAKKGERFTKVKGMSSVYMRTCFKPLAEVKSNFEKYGFKIKYESEFVLETNWKKSADIYEKPVTEVTGENIEVKYVLVSRSNLRGVVWNEYLKGVNGKILGNTFYFKNRKLDGSRGSNLRNRYCIN